MNKNNSRLGGQISKKKKNNNNTSVKVGRATYQIKHIETQITIQNN